MMKNKRTYFKSYQAILLILSPIVLAFIALCIGRMQIAPNDVFNSIISKISSGNGGQYEQIIWSIRFPRIILAILVGSGLATAGCAFQSLFSNPLATPDTLGVASGASFGAVVGILLGFGIAGIQIISLVFGILAVILTYISGRGKGRDISTFVLAGIMIGSLFNALISLAKYTADTESQLPAITYWLMGSLNGKSYDTLAIGAPPILLGIIILFLLRWRLNVLPLTEDEAKSTGTNLKLLRIVTVLCATVITASCVSMCGQVGWVGLLIPHICRMRYGTNHMAIVPASISIGASFMIVVDTLARSASAAEIPISILTAIIGAPFFIMLMRRSGGWKI